MIAKFHSVYNIFEQDIEEPYDEIPSELTDEELNQIFDYIDTEHLEIDGNGNIDDSFITLEEKELEELLKHEPVKMVV